MDKQYRTYPEVFKLEALRAHPVQALSNRPQRLLHPRPIRRPALPPARLALQLAAHQPHQALALQLRHRGHLVQQLALTPPIRSPIPFLYHPQIFPPFIDRPLLVAGHGSLGNIFF